MSLPTLHPTKAVPSQWIIPLNKLSLYLRLRTSIRWSRTVSRWSAPAAVSWSRHTSSMIICFQTNVASSLQGMIGINKASSTSCKSLLAMKVLGTWVNNRCPQAWLLAGWVGCTGPINSNILALTNSNYLWVLMIKKRTRLNLVVSSSSLKVMVINITTMALQHTTKYFSLRKNSEKPMKS